MSTCKRHGKLEDGDNCCPYCAEPPETRECSVADCKDTIDIQHEGVQCGSCGEWFCDSCRDNVMMYDRAEQAWICPACESPELKARILAEDKADADGVELARGDNE